MYIMHACLVVPPRVRSKQISSGVCGLIEPTSRSSAPSTVNRTAILVLGLYLFDDRSVRMTWTAQTGQVVAKLQQQPLQLTETYIARSKLVRCI
jgi:hypothetical protein